MLLLLLTPLQAATNADWTTPIAPFRIAGNLYYVGSRDLASYLIVTPQGDILINSSLESSVPLIRSSVEQLGFKFQDVKILLISHAHSDHDAGSAEIKRETGAQYMVMDGDVPVVESGGAQDFQYPDGRYPALKVDRVLHDADQVRLGDAVLIARKTPGHTRGCTTWTMQVRDGQRLLNVVIVGSWNVNPGYRLVDRPGQPASYPGLRQTFSALFRCSPLYPAMFFWGRTALIFICWRNSSACGLGQARTSGWTRSAIRPLWRNVGRLSRRSCYASRCPHDPQTDLIGRPHVRRSAHASFVHRTRQPDECAAG
jgi:metallo-beta-lactamase class B